MQRHGIRRIPYINVSLAAEGSPGHKLEAGGRGSWKLGAKRRRRRQIPKRGAKPASLLLRGELAVGNGKLYALLQIRNHLSSHSIQGHNCGMFACCWHSVIIHTHVALAHNFFHNSRPFYYFSRVWGLVSRVTLNKEGRKCFV